MADAPARLSPLAGMEEAFRRASSPAVTLAEAPLLAQFNLRGDPARQEFVDAVSGPLGVALPTRVGAVALGVDLTVLALGPDEWLLVRPAEANGEVVIRLRTALARLHASLVDVSCNRTVLTLGGAQAREVLRKGVTLDLHPRVFGPGRCAQTLMARTPVLIEQTGEAPDYRLFVRASYARHLAAWLIEAAREFAPAP